MSEWWTLFWVGLVFGIVGWFGGVTGKEAKMGKNGTSKY